MIGNIASRLRSAIRSFASKGHVDEQELSELVRELQRVLIASDVDVKLVSELSKRIKERGLEEKPLPGLTVKEHVLRVVYDELVKLVGEGEEVPVREDMRMVLLGLYGSGKTTTAGKLGRWLRKRGVRPTLVSLDRDRPAAYEQLEQLADRLDLPASRELVSGSQVVDTAGRDALSGELLEQARSVVREAEPHEVLLVVPAEMGHEAGRQAEAFGDLLTGVVITRMDGSAKGGGALSACAQAGVPVAFLGTGERLADLEPFEPKRYISRLLGWGDIKGLLEKAKEVQEEMGTFDPSDLSSLNMVTFYKQMEALTKMGPFEKVLQMVGLTDMDKGTVKDMKGKMRRYKSIIDSMTREERLDPSLLGNSRMKRIAAGSGTELQDVRSLLKEFKNMKKMLKRLQKGGMGRRGRGGAPGNINLKDLKRLGLR